MERERDILTESRIRAHDGCAFRGFYFVRKLYRGAEVAITNHPPPLAVPCGLLVEPK